MTKLDILLRRKFEIEKEIINLIGEHSSVCVDIGYAIKEEENERENTKN